MDILPLQRALQNLDIALDHEDDAAALVALRMVVLTGWRQLHGHIATLQTMTASNFGQVRLDALWTALTQFEQEVVRDVSGSTLRAPDSIVDMYHHHWGQPNGTYATTLAGITHDMRCPLDSLCYALNECAKQEHLPVALVQSIYVTTTEVKLLKQLSDRIRAYLLGPEPFLNETINDHS